MKVSCMRVKCAMQLLELIYSKTPYTDVIEFFISLHVAEERYWRICCSLVSALLPQQIRSCQGGQTTQGQASSTKCTFLSPPLNQQKRKKSKNIFKIKSSWKNCVPDKWTNGPVNAHLRSALYTNKHDLAVI